GDAVGQLYRPLVGAPTEMIRNGVDDDQFRPGAGDGRRLRPPGARVVVGFAGRLVPQKRPEDFIAAAAHVAAIRPDVAFLMAGDGSRREAYVAEARRAGAHTLTVTGYVADMRDFYAACDVLVLPSRSEGCPNVVLEAMAMKTAVIAADTPSVREILTHDRHGLLYPVGDVAALVGALERLFDEGSLRRTLVERAYRRIRSELNARVCAGRTAAILRRVAGARGSIPAPATSRAPSLPARPAAPILPIRSPARSAD